MSASSLHKGLCAVLVSLILCAGAPAAVDGRRQSEKAQALDHFIRGTVADVMEDHYRAIFHYQEALRCDSTSPFIYVALAQDYVLLGNPVQAEALLDRALRLQPNHVPALELKALLLRSMGRNEAAVEVLRRLVQAAPDDGEHVSQLLAAELGAGDFKEAQRLHERLKATGKDDVSVLDRQVLAVYLSVGQFERAATLLDQLIAQDSTDAGLVYALGNCRLQQGDTTRAEELLRRANRMEPGEPRYWIALAAVAMGRQDFARVTDLVDSALARTPPHASLFSLKGLALYRTGKLAESIPVFQQAIELDSTMYVAMGSLALVYDELDSVERAVELYERAIRLSDSAATYLNNLAYTYASRGTELERAKALVRRALEIEPDNSAYLDTMGWVEYGLGDYRAAIRWLEKARRADPSNTATLEHLGDAQLKLGKRSKALRYYREALRIDPANEKLRRKIEP
ncbi:MAG: tetratricopeptide repeat protein [bacterium]|nr:tetratricopeptide repeat protein [bacterium]